MYSVNTHYFDTLVFKKSNYYWLLKNVDKLKKTYFSTKFCIWGFFCNLQQLFSPILIATMTLLIALHNILNMVATLQL